MNTRLAVLAAFSLMLPVSPPAWAERDDSPPDYDLCVLSSEVPLIKTLREKKTALSHEEASIGRSYETLRRKCNLFKQNPCQDCPALADIKENLGKIQAEAPPFFQKVEEVRPIIRKAQMGMNGLGDKQCPEALRTWEQRLVVVKNRIESQIRTACDFGDAASRSERAANDISGAYGSQEESRKIQDVLLNPRANRAESKRLLDQAEAYHQKLIREGRIPANTPSPRSGPNDNICGESCAAYLRAQTLESTTVNFTPGNAYYRNALDTALSTRRARYGDLIVN